MPLSNALPTLEASVDDEQGVNGAGVLLTQRYPAVARDVELSRQELRENGMLAAKQWLDREVSELRAKSRLATPKIHKA